MSAERELSGSSGTVPGSAFDDLKADDEKTRRRAARQIIAAYHEEELDRLLEHVRGGFARKDAGEIDAFELDALIHRYKKCATKLWSFCGSSGGQWLQAAQSLAYLREQGDEPDWWETGAPQRDR